MLDLSIQIEPEQILRRLEILAGCSAASPFHQELLQAVEDAFYRLICPGIETDVRLELKLASDRSAVAIFADNLRHLLLASPLGGRPVLGIDPGIRTGCKCAIVDATGKYLESATIFLSGGDHAQQQAKKILSHLIGTYNPYAIAVGNGTAGRETEAFVRRYLKEAGCETAIVVPVNESGASVYSASDVAREEFPDLGLYHPGGNFYCTQIAGPLCRIGQSRS